MGVVIDSHATVTEAQRAETMVQQEDQMDMKGVVINHSIDHRTSVSQQFDTFYKAVKVAAGKLNPNLVKPIQTLIGLTNPGYSVDFPEASLWTKGGVEDIHKKEMYSCLWLEEKKERSKDRKKYEHNRKVEGETRLKKIRDDADDLKLIKHLTKIKKFIGAYQDASKDPIQYVEAVQMRFDVLKAAGVRIESEELTQYTIKRVFPSQDYSTYATMNAEAKQTIQDGVKQLLVTKQIGCYETNML
eukprot:jgi/Psemu1/35544/gm1.35544_g